MSGEHPWKLVAPWWSWEPADDPQAGRSTAPLIQMFAADDFVEGFLKRPQHSLRFDEAIDRVGNITLVGTALAVAKAQAAQSWMDGGADALRVAEVPHAALRKSPMQVRLVPSGTRKLFLPVHGRHYLVTCELHCEAREFPSVAPTQVCGSGFVVRRLSAPVPRELERELFGLQQAREQAAADCAAPCAPTWRGCAGAAWNNWSNAASWPALCRRHKPCWRRPRPPCRLGAPGTASPRWWKPGTPTPPTPTWALGSP
jgi:hypothetical protein